TALLDCEPAHRGATERERSRGGKQPHRTAKMKLMLEQLLDRPRVQIDAVREIHFTRECSPFWRWAKRNVKKQIGSCDRQKRVKPRRKKDARNERRASGGEQNARPRNEVAPKINRRAADKKAAESPPRIRVAIAQNFRQINGENGRRKHHPKPAKSEQPEQAV